MLDDDKMCVCKIRSHVLLLLLLLLEELFLLSIQCRIIPSALHFIHFEYMGRAAPYPRARTEIKSKYSRKRTNMFLYFIFCLSFFHHLPQLSYFCCCCCYCYVVYAVTTNIFPTFSFRWLEFGEMNFFFPNNTMECRRIWVIIHLFFLLSVSLRCRRRLFFYTFWTLLRRNRKRIAHGCRLLVERKKTKQWWWRW